METVNLFDIASANSSALETDFSGLLDASTADQASQLHQFKDWVYGTGKVSINMRPEILISFLMTGHHQNIYEWAVIRAAESHRPEDDIIREKLGVYYPRRRAFDDYLEGSRQFRYGALNVGGTGATYYGDYCVVFDIAYLRVPDGLHTCGPTALILTSRAT